MKELIFYTFKSDFSPSIFRVFFDAFGLPLLRELKKTPYVKVNKGGVYDLR